MLHLILSILVGSSASAASDCPSLAEVSGRIQYCSHNDEALNQAKTCAAKIHADWAKANSDIQKQLADLKSKVKSQQEDTLATSRSGYEKTVAELYRQILEMQKNTALVASYAQAMINFAEEGNVDEPDATCFTENFDKLQPLVTDLDKEILKAKVVYQEMLALRSRTNKATVGLDYSSPGSAPTVTTKKGQGSGAIVKGSKTRDSDVTGIKEDQEKRSKEKK